MTKRLCYMLLCVFFLTNCSSDNCLQSDWVGTFVKMSEDCDNGGTPLFEDSATFIAGSCNNCVSAPGSIDLMFDENCQITQETPLFGDLIYTLEGDVIFVNAPLLDCTAEYKKEE